MATRRGQVTDGLSQGEDGQSSRGRRWAPSERRHPRTSNNLNPTRIQDAGSHALVITKFASRAAEPCGCPKTGISTPNYQPWHLPLKHARVRRANRDTEEPRCLRVGHQVTGPNRLLVAVRLEGRVGVVALLSHLGHLAAAAGAAWLCPRHAALAPRFLTPGPRSQPNRSPSPNAPRQSGRRIKCFPHASTRRRHRRNGLRDDRQTPGIASEICGARRGTRTHGLRLRRPAGLPCWFSWVCVSLGLRGTAPCGAWRLYPDLAGCGHRFGHGWGG